MSTSETAAMPVQTETPPKPLYSSAGSKWQKVPVKPAARVWTEAMPTSPGEQVEFFRREGFLILRGVVNKDDLAELDREVARMVGAHRTLPRIREGFDLEPNQDPARGAPTFRKIGGIGELSPAFGALMRHPRVMEKLHAVMGPVIELYRDVIMMKPRRVGREKPWHQDSVYWPWNPMDLVSGMTALDDATPENGCLQVIPRTHGKELHHFGQELQIEIDGALQAQTCYVPLQAGDTLLFHSLLLHASEPNTSAHDRRVVIFSYKTPGLKYIGKGTTPRDTIVVHDVRPAGYV